MKTIISLSIKLILLIIFINPIIGQKTTGSYKTDDEPVDLLNVPKLSFYKDLNTLKNRSQIECISFNDECDDGEPDKIICLNNDYKNYSKVNSTTLNWTCKPDLLSYSYYIDENSVEVKCENLFKTDKGIFVAAGSCYVSFILYKKAVYKNYLFILIAALVLSLIIGLVFYLRNRRKRGYTSV